MPELPEEQALEAIRSWWDELGVPADDGLMRAYARARADAAKAHTRQAAARPAAPQRPEDPAAAARRTADDCRSLQDLKTALEAFPAADLKAGARSTVVFDGIAGAPVMVIGEGPGADEDRKGLPFVGQAGKLLDLMLDAIGLSRETNTLITNVNFWRPPANRNPEPEELSVCRPFLERMIDLQAPKLVIAAGGVSAKSLLASKVGIMRLHGTEHNFATQAGTSMPLFPIFHPAYLLRRPQDKAIAWRDLLMIESRARDLGVEL